METSRILPPSPSGKTFYRRFALALDRNSLKLPLGRMDLQKGFVSETRGDPYPLLSKGEGTEEAIKDGKYKVSGEASRLLGGHFPYASYEIGFEKLAGAAGIGIETASGAASFLLTNDALVMRDGGKETRLPLGVPFEAHDALVLTFRGAKCDIYRKRNGYFTYLATFESEALKDILSEDVWSRAHASLTIKGEAIVEKAEFYLEAGIAVADIRVMKYESGEPVTENGRIFFTVSLRLQEGCRQGVLSWLPGTADWRLEGALFYDAGDGLTCGDVAASATFDRRTGEWIVWMCSFSHDHVLARTKTREDIRFGLHILDVECLEKLPEGASDETFGGKTGDEDPDLIWNEKENCWYFAICRLTEDEKGRGYRYFFYKSDDPMQKFTYLYHMPTGEDTGGSFVPTRDGLYFCCGSSFDRRADYRLYRLPEMESYENLQFDYDDGGFRGWGTLVPVGEGKRARWYHLTFDRARASDYNWSYGNLYCFEAK